MIGVTRSYVCHVIFTAHELTLTHFVHSMHLQSVGAMDDAKDAQYAN